MNIISCLDPGKVPKDDRFDVKRVDEKKKEIENHKLDDNHSQTTNLDKKRSSEAEEEFLLSLRFELSKTESDKGVHIKGLYKSKQKLTLNDLFSNEDQHKLIHISKYLQNKNVKLADFEDLTWAETNRTLLQIFDLVMAFCFDFRINELESGPESNWTMSKISPSLSYYVEYSSAARLVQDVVRRIQLYPLVRSKELGIEAFIDAKSLFFYDRLLVLKALVEILKIFEKDSPYYLFNNLFVRPFIYFIQIVSAENYSKFLKLLSEFKISSI